MKNYAGDFLEDSVVRCLFTTNDKAGGIVAPSSAFENADVTIYKDGSDAQKATVNGITMTSPFDATVGLHLLEIDTSDDTGDAGFWVTGSDYQVYSAPDETIDGESVGVILLSFSIENRLMRGTDGANTTVPDAAGVAATEAEVIAAVAGFALASVCTEARLARLDVDVSSRNATAPDNANIVNIHNIVKAAGDGDLAAIKVIMDKYDGLLEVDSGGNTFTVQALQNAPTAEMNAAELQAAMKAMIGLTVGGTWTWEKLMKITNAWIAGDWRRQVADPSIQELLDPEDGSVILEQVLDKTPAAGSKYKTITVKI